MKVYCFGNEFMKNDALAKELADKLKVPGVEFVKCDNVEMLFEEKGTIYIMDVVKELKEITIITDLDKFKVGETLTCHDFDLGYFLKLMQKMGSIQEVVIIGLPQIDSKI